MVTKQYTLIIVLALFVSMIIPGCGPTQVAEPTATALPPTPTPAPVAGIEVPITVDGAELLIVMATNDTTLYDSGPFMIQTQPGETVLHIEAQIVSGDIDLATLAKGISLTDENGEECPLVSYGNEEPVWEFMVTKSSQSFALHLSDGQAVKLDSILQIIP